MGIGNIDVLRLERKKKNQRKKEKKELMKLAEKYAQIELSLMRRFRSE